MKVALVLDMLVRGGAERQALYAADQLIRLGCDVELIYYHRSDVEYDCSRISGLRVTFLPKRRNRVAYLYRLQRLLRHGRFDIVHAFKGPSSIYGCPAGRWAGAPVVLAGARAEYIDKGILRAAHKVADRCADGWVVNSEAIRTSLVERLGVSAGRVHLVYSGVDAEAFRTDIDSGDARSRLGLNPEARTVSMIAQIRPEKNHDFLLDVAARVSHRMRDVRFLVVGDGEARSRLEARAAALGIGAAVRFLGNRTDIPEVLAATSVSVLTSHYEGLANVLLESMAVGIPVVSTDYLSIGELITQGHQGFVIPQGDADAMADALVRLLDDPALRREMGERGRAFVQERFSLAAMGRRLYEVYAMCLEQARRSGRTK